MSAWLVHLSTTVVDSDGPAVELESSESITTSSLQPATVRELKERLFGYSSSKGCNIIELGAPSYPLLLFFVFPKLWDPHNQQLTTEARVLGAGTGIVSLVLAGLRSAVSSASAPVSHAESCILSTDLREFSIFHILL